MAAVACPGLRQATSSSSQPMTASTVSTACSFSRHQDNHPSPTFNMGSMVDVVQMLTIWMVAVLK